MRLVVGTGPTELHAHIDLDHRITGASQAVMAPAVTVLDVTCSDWNWAVLAAIHTDKTREGAR